MPLLAVREPEQGEPCFVFPSVQVQMLQRGLCFMMGRFSSSVWHQRVEGGDVLEPGFGSLY